MWNSKTKILYKPTFFANENYNQERRWDRKKKNFRYVWQNPLHFDYSMIHMNGGIKPFYASLIPANTGDDANAAMQRCDVPIHKRCYIIYHMGKQGVMDPKALDYLDRDIRLNAKGEIVELGMRGEQNMAARFAMGAVVGYYKLNIGSSESLAYFEKYLCDNALELNCRDVVEVV